MLFRITDKRESDAGASLIELALILPVVMILIAGLVDIGFKINRVKTISTAARHAARIAASHSKSLSVVVPCGSPLALACDPGDSPTPIATTTVTGVAHHAACNFLRSAGYSAEDWRVIVDRPKRDNRSEDGPGEAISATGNFFVASVQVERLENKCLICYDQIFQMLHPRSTSSFVLEGACS